MHKRYINNLICAKGGTTMENHPEKPLYSRKDTIQVLLGIPVVCTFAVICANFVTSYAGI